MKLEVFAVLDQQAGAFMRPMFLQSRGVAMRVVGDAVNSKTEGELLASHPEDFRLFRLGEWDDQSALFKTDLPELVCDVASLKV